MQAAVNTTTVGAHPHPTKSSFLRPSPPCRVYFHASPRPNLRAIAMASKSQLQDQLIITRPDDWHLHLREGGVLEAVVPHRFVSPSLLIVFLAVHAGCST
jgi:dihydroorotase